MARGGRKARSGKGGGEEAPAADLGPHYPQSHTHLLPASRRPSKPSKPQHRRAHFKSGLNQQRVAGFVAGAVRPNAGAARALAVHFYPPYTSDGFGSQELLSEGLVRQAVQDYQNLASWAGGLPLPVTEANSKSKGGIQGLSDAFAAALWTLDFAMEMAAAGAPMLLLHWRIGGEPGGKAGPHWPAWYAGVETGFGRGGGGGGGGAAGTFPKARAPFAGYLAFARAVLPPGGGDVRLARVARAAAGPGCGGVKLFPLSVARGGGGRELRLVVLNKKASGACRLTLQLQAPAGGGAGGSGYAPSASLQWLLPGGGSDAAAAAAGFAAGGGCDARGRACDAAKAAAAVGGGLASARGDATVGGQALDTEGGLSPAAARTYAVPVRPTAGGGGAEIAFTVPGAAGALLVIPERGP